MKPALAHEYTVSSFGRLTSIVRDTGVIEKENRHYNATHGMSKSLEYRTWILMKRRCYDINDINYKSYGGRGIKVCPEWIESFETFFAYMGKKPSHNHSIDRINTNGNYEPGNVRWATRLQQARNKRMNRLIEYMGESKTMGQWCEILHLPLKRTELRFNRGHPLDIVFKQETLPNRNQRRKTTK